MTRARETGRTSSLLAPPPLSGRGASHDLAARPMPSIRTIILCAVPAGLAIAGVLGFGLPGSAALPTRPLDGTLRLEPSQVHALRDAVFEITHEVTVESIEVLGTDRGVLYHLPALGAKPRLGLRVVGSALDHGHMPIVVQDGLHSVAADIEWSFHPLTKDGDFPHFLFAGVLGTEVEASLDLVVPDPAATTARLLEHPNAPPGCSRGWRCTLAIDPDDDRVLRVEVAGAIPRVGDTRLQVELTHGGQTSLLPIVLVGDA
ncbi:MAG: hypothetical protein AB7O97_06935 [Planctomycetota bacterium]